MKAVKRFNPEVGVRLVSFAVHWIKAEIHEYVLRNWRIVKVATTKAQRKLFFNLRKSKKRLGWFNAEEVNMVAEQLGVDAAEVREMESRLAAQDAGFDAGADDDERDGGSVAPVFYLEDKSSDVATNLESQNWEDHANRRLARPCQVWMSAANTLSVPVGWTTTTKQHCRNWLITTRYLQNVFANWKRTRCVN